MKNLFWNSFEIAVNFYQAFLQIWFIYKFFQPSAKKSVNMMSGVFGVILGTALTILNSITLFEGFYSYIYVVIVFLYASVAFTEKIIKKVFVSILSFSIVLIITIVELNFIASVFEISVEQMITDESVKRLICIIVIQISIYFALRLALTVFKYADEYAFSDWLPIITLLIATYIFSSLLHVLSLSINEDQRIIINLANVVLLILNFVMFYVIHSLYEKNKRINEMKIIEVKEQYLEQFIDNANLQYESIRKIRHDIKDRLSTVYELLSNGKTEEAMKFIERSNGIVKATMTFVQTNNAVANAIINSKLTAASTLGIKVSCITVSDFTGINELDLCDLLSNTLENAITACEMMSADSNRFIYLEIGKENNIYTFMIKNSLNKSVISQNPKLKTTKKDRINHGFGTSIIRDIANKYSGRYDYYEIDNTFCCSIILES